MPTEKDIPDAPKQERNGLEGTPDPKEVKKKEEEQLEENPQPQPGKPGAIIKDLETSKDTPE